MLEGELLEKQLLEVELHDAECTLVGEVQQIERLAEENNNKVRTAGHYSTAHLCLRVVYTAVDCNRVHTRVHEHSTFTQIS